MNEAKRDEIYALKTEVNQKQQKLREVELKCEQQLKEKDREVEDAKNDLTVC